MAAPHGICPRGMEQSDVVAWDKIEPAEWSGPMWPTQFYWGLSVITFFLLPQGWGEETLTTGVPAISL